MNTNGRNLENPDGTVWEPVRATTVMNRNGEELAATVYRRRCRSCGEWFEVTQVDRGTSRGNLEIVRCPPHRNRLAWVARRPGGTK
jgi:uncharacterized protein YbaR (Trm112 family)